MKDKALLAAAMAGGYVLGRTKKGRFALGVGSYMLTRRHNVDPKQLAVEGARRLGAAPQVSRLTGQVRGELAQAGKTALSAAMQRQVGALADRIDRRADELVGGGRSSEAPEKAPEKENDEGGDGLAEDSDSTQASESAADSEAEEKEPRRRGRRESERPAKVTHKARGPKSRAEGKAAAPESGARQKPSGGSSGRTGRTTSGGTRRSSSASAAQKREARHDD
ncbi:hypothetical protein [Yinghuangia sp. YIM S10712]|uniref:hypothetical protein n=1 Tax=Yinghuangia sp. YIM S10712 TaxID=3436930 RepID=UPI003F532AD8